MSAKFWRHVDRAGPDDCWEWTGARSGKDAIGNGGYGSFRLDGRVMGAHRAAYILTHGEIPSGKIVMHTCDNRTCVNPAHLRAGTSSENTQDMLAKGRNNPPTGDANPNSKLNAEAIRLIIRAYDSGIANGRQLSDAFRVSQPLISQIVRGKAWRHVAIGGDQ